jgi:hypothetical protein
VLVVLVLVLVVVVSVERLAQAPGCVKWLFRSLL